MPDEQARDDVEPAGEQPSVWEIRVGVYATEAQANEAKERFVRLLCPDPEHEPPCPVPWSAWVVHESDLDDPELYAELTEQGEAERHLRS